MIGFAPFRIPGPARWHTAFYRSAAAFLAKHYLAGPEVTGIYLRRSVAAGEAQFPWSDVDLGMTLSAFSNAREEGEALADLWRRFQRARAIFPRLGETLIYTAGDFSESVVDDPYRASIDRRVAIPVYGELPVMEPGTIPTFAAIRRLVFWLDTYLPRALHTRNHRNARKFAIEMWNAWRTASGKIREPFVSRLEAAADWRNSEDAALLIRTEHGAEASFRVALALATRSHAAFLPALPRLAKAISLRTQPAPDGVARTLHVIPFADSTLPEGPAEANAAIFTPEALDLFLNTQNPLLWHELPESVSETGISPPSLAAWLDTCRRLSAQTRLRVAGFVEPGAGNPERRLARVEWALGVLERGGSPSLEKPETPDAPSAPELRDDPGACYRQRYPELLRRSIALRQRAERCLARRATPPASGGHP